MHSSPRFKKHTTNSFFGDFLYDLVVPSHHFLRQAKELINWQPFTQRCLVWYQGFGEVGKRVDEKILTNFLDKRYKEMPRTMLRYAIERLPEETRKYYLAK